MSQPENLQYTIVNQNAVCVTWQAPKQFSRKIVKYQIYYSANRNGPIESWDYVTVDVSSKTKACVVS